jgi:glyoxylase-like metal-dependent hydrolase (beta-lactamase superfamily II)
MKIKSIETGLFKLDGGAMFGVVPKKMWNRLNPADENNLCTWTMRCLLVDDGERVILFDTGMGNKQNEKFMSHFHPHGEDSLRRSIQNAGYKMEDITDVFITHFHFDHCGGALYKNEKGLIEPSFPNAIYWTNERHYNWAYDSNAREAASFLKENFQPLKEMGILKFIDVEEDVKFTDRIKVNYYYGHTECMMVPTILTDKGDEIVFPADLLPSEHHVRMPYVMSYDVRPLETLKDKERFYEKAVADNCYIFFEHDKDRMMGKLIKNEGNRFAIAEVDESSLIDF